MVQQEISSGTKILVESENVEGGRIGIEGESGSEGKGVLEVRTVEKDPAFTHARNDLEMLVEGVDTFQEAVSTGTWGIRFADQILEVIGSEGDDQTTGAADAGRRARRGGEPDTA